ncbi:hypothetical protein OUZ56_008310 [Daphnia magna]|uniref:Uncharacterized protein n=1 Tax=Daphnia magna TaxID=35525 RepID=A0ABR0ACL6_9CRUS|nr:hypothetical protein OUZ56_008310 [Daphnia magna]
MGRSELGVVKPLGGRDENDDICVVTESRERIGKHARLAGADVLLSGTAHHAVKERKAKHSGQKSQKALSHRLTIHHKKIRKNPTATTNHQPVGIHYPH